jgi:prolyl-tRNA synthetase
MNKIGSQELVLPVLHPIELWQETNRTVSVGFELQRIKDRRGAEFALGGTAEEMAVDLVRKFNISYRDLPFTIYQFSMKFRDEMRARGGLLRLREFIMKDAYSFGNEEQFKQTYTEMADAYTDLFKELGLKTTMVEADNGYIGGEYCHEFIVESEIGESRYFTTADGKYAAHEDVAKFVKYKDDSNEELKPKEEVLTEGITGANKLAEFLNIPVEKTTKTILFENDKGQVVAAVVNGIYDVNLTKLQHITGDSPLKLASPETVKKVTGAEIGYVGFLNLPEDIKVYLDDSLKDHHNFEVGANKTNYHIRNVNLGRDFPEPDKFYDIAMARPGDQAPENAGELIEKRGIEVGNIFQLGYHYSSLMEGAEYTDADGQIKKYYMGCYGIGVARTLAAIVETHHDDKGIVWPETVAPAKVYLVRIGDEENTVKAADSLYEELKSANIDTLYDDREESAGVKFADADLIGCPIRLTISPRTLESQSAELKHRNEEKTENIPLGEVVARL